MNLPLICIHENWTSFPMRIFPALVPDISAHTMYANSNCVWLTYGCDQMATPTPIMNVRIHLTRKKSLSLSALLVTLGRICYVFRPIVGNISPCNLNRKPSIYLYKGMVRICRKCCKLKTVYGYKQRLYHLIYNFGGRFWVEFCVHFSRQLRAVPQDVCACIPWVCLRGIAVGSVKMVLKVVTLFLSHSSAL